ncbi:MAG: rod shape-determining protein [Candidatus Liptonbacteria bacterium RIFOXYC1_FULL_36_8]|uniref:Cell shape-determining protein MreB n=3 Tax=Candidatus Liptoniibacteriota TaxID=1817909 RepID=A0A1G2CKW0_9BACT|nr:MAG: rod shape-determining protein [Candidatus Liptonbacteria bacterium RIFOXYB1_FULL_36_10]OGZ04061.1 MAG: rod shape-determining protein [Candidatus Liptonbacteria bacterium RIFOXYC1_FULL_36_8]OGZ04414.1 MAG: rod shape-determining protein [Candidatus Liptonbacteria bacterium RIFOXYD1_FULL_36_11]
MFNPLSYFGKDIGVDLGTANILVYVKGRGIVINEPSISAINNKTNQILAVGEEAKKMLGRTPMHISVIRPLVKGVISDFEVAQEILRHMLRKISPSSSFLNFQKVIIGIPSNLTEVERKSAEDVVIAAGGNKAYLVEEPVAAALGANLPIEEATSNMIVDIGGGTTEIAIISMGGVVVSKSLKIAGDELTSDIVKFVKDEFKLIIGETTAEEIKINIGSVVPGGEKIEMSARGRDVSSGLPREIIIRGSHVRAALSKSVKSIVDSVREIIETAPPELVGDMLKHGIYLSGGGALLRGLDQLIEKETAVSTKIVEEPLTCVVRGIGSIIENYSKLKYILDNPLRPKEIIL